MPKHPVLPGLAPIRPQLRPENPVEHEPWTHRHCDMPKHELGPHLASKKRAKEHRGVGLRDEHKHREASRYVLGPGGDDAKRLDVNPLTDFSKPGRVFFVIEGTPKCDALVSAGEKAFDVPSVAQWAAPELPAFAALYLREAPVFVVCDSDWHENPEVIFHATCCREYLRRLGVEQAHVAAPRPRKRPDEDGSFKNGVDDFLGPYGSPRGRHSPDALLVPSRVVDEDAFARWLAAYAAARGGYAKTLERDEGVARMLVLASEGGTTFRSVAALTRALVGGPRYGRRPRACGHERYQKDCRDCRASDLEAIEAEERWTSREWGVYRCLVRLGDAGAASAYRPTGRFSEWVSGGWRRVKGDKFVWMRGGLRQRVPELALHGDLRLVERAPATVGGLTRLAKVQTEK